MKAVYPTFGDIALSIYQLCKKAPNFETDQEQEGDPAAEKVQATEKSCPVTWII